MLDTSPDSEVLSPGFKYYDVTVKNLLAAGLLKEDEKLVMLYGPRGGEKRQYEATDSYCSSNCYCTSVTGFVVVTRVCSIGYTVGFLQRRRPEGFPELLQH